MVNVKVPPAHRGRDDVLDANSNVDQSLFPGPKHTTATLLMNISNEQRLRDGGPLALSYLLSALSFFFKAASRFCSCSCSLSHSCFCNIEQRPLGFGVA